MLKFAQKSAYFLKNNSSYFFSLILLFTWYDLFLIQDINLATADLGRHLKNGQIFWEQHFIPKTNFYSYTYPDFPFINHHWGSGALFFLIWKFFDFPGLSLLYITVSFSTFFIIFHLTKKVSGFWIAFPLSILLIPLIAERTEVRPEVFSYFFSALFFFVLWQWKNQKIPSRWLYCLPIFQILWVNSHIYFLLGLLIIGVFLAEEMFFYFPRSVRLFLRVEFSKLNDIRKLFSVFVLTFLASFINPYGIKGVFYPFFIFQNYGYRIIENQSIWFLEKLAIIQNSNFLLAKISLFLLVLSFVLIFIYERKKFSLALFILCLIFGSMAALAIRNLTIFGFFCLPILAFNINVILDRFKPTLSSLKITSFFSVILIFLFIRLSHPHFFENISQRNIGLVPKINAGANFFKENELSGPIFNNYDIGSYLIFHLYPQEKIFVDNRPEAYPADFLENIYIKSQEDPEIFKKTDEKYKFNTVFFYLNDATPWGQNFLINLIDNPNWTPVFADGFSIIFVKNNESNEHVIEKFKIPRSAFSQKII